MDIEISPEFDDSDFIDLDFSDSDSDDSSSVIVVHIVSDSIEDNVVLVDDITPDLIIIPSSESLVF